MKLDDIFRDFDRPKNKLVEKLPPESKTVTLMLYRGFNLDFGGVKRENDKIKLSPTKSEQGMMWFSHSLVRLNTPYKEYALSHASKWDNGYLLTYPLKCTKHYQTKVYSDGTTYDAIPDEILDMTNPTEDCNLHMGIELPNGWVFSYKHEKFIGCTKYLYVDSDMLTKI
tara:strand:- start:231 stop:737 length:507 start_codon:yes stop_codon:yes gene_type:complete